MPRLVASQMIVPNLHLLTLEAPAVAREVRPGQFVILRAEDDGERVPLSVADWDVEAGTVSVVVMNVGRTTGRLAALAAGDSVPTVVGPLGNPTALDRWGTVLCLGGCYGIGSIYPIARALHELGNRVITVLEARSAFLLYWEDRLRRVSERLVVITRDGSRGLRGHVGRLGEVLRAEEPVHRVIVNGCTFVMKRATEVTRPLALKTVVSLNPIMIDGTGMCGVCRITVGGATRFACVDGPDFDGHEVDWAELLQRRKTYLDEEVVPLRTSRCERPRANGHA
jgi:ferredoxin/flavodoxin---NADP+ reductase